MKTQKKALETRKSRDAKRKLQRLQAEKATRASLSAVLPSYADCNLRMIVDKEDRVLIGLRRGEWGHTNPVILPISPETIVGATEDAKEFATILTQLGMLTLSTLLKYDLADGPEKMAKALAKFAKIDLEALKTEAEESDLDEIIGTSVEESVETTNKELSEDSPITD